MKEDKKDNAKKQTEETKAKPEVKKTHSAKGKAAKADSGPTIKIEAPGATRISSSKPARLLTHYREKVIPMVMKEFEFTNTMQVPRFTKVVLNCAVNDAVANPKVLDNALEEFMSITGQKAVLTRAKKSIATFKVRKGLPVGVTVTLRRARMYEILDRMLNVALPRVRDFKGLSPKSFDGRGSYSLGIREQIIFPEVNYDRVDKIRGFTVTIGTTARKSEHARAVLAALGMPFRK
ncbi:MAG: 50S ribosomal protein L5 [Deltaproteobacteria bacterium]|nr:50S ribosomal protein L5 [Deltaproteobacteria bacterium]